MLVRDSSSTNQPLFAVVLSYFFLRGEQLHAIGLLGIVVSVAGVILLLVGN